MMPEITKNKLQQPTFYYVSGKLKINKSIAIPIHFFQQLINHICHKQYQRGKNCKIIYKIPFLFILIQSQQVDKTSLEPNKLLFFSIMETTPF